MPEDLSKLSLSFSSSASARLLRYSDRFTRPTVWVLSRSSAVAFWEVKREDRAGFGVASLDEGFEDSIALR